MLIKTIYILLSILLFAINTAFAGAVQLPQTGQTKCYDTAGAEIECAGTGQDGEIRTRVARDVFLIDNYRG